MTEHIKEVVLVYNADWSIPGAVAFVTQALRGTDDCALCDITHSGLTEKPGWRSCRAQMPVSVRALYRNQLTPALTRAAAGKYPCVLVAVDDGYTRLLERATLEDCAGDPAALVAAIERAAQARGFGLRREPFDP